MAMMAAEVRYAVGQPDRMIMLDEDLSPREASYVATDAAQRARLLLPRVSGRTARRLEPISGEGWFGVYFPDPTVWYLERGTKPFTMRSLAGRTVPMWITDTDGTERAKNPKAQTRITEDGRHQVLIFRKAAQIGAQKTKVTKDGRMVSTPMSYPGAPGRIGTRDPYPQIGAGNVGVRWRHPGISGQGYLNQAVSEAAIAAGLNADTIYVADGASWEAIISGDIKGLI